ncbi:MAG TPA: IS110 family transposase [Candidatus Limnocylindrales bacterium]|jgi:transposase
MVIIGVDSHKRTHTVVAVDGNGRKLAEKTVATSPDGHLELVRWARRWRERTWALEDCRQLTRRLEGDLLRTGARVVRVPPKLMAGARRSAREPGKSDPIDALAVARAALREPNLPTASLDGVERELRLLVDHREDLIADRTAHQARLRWFLVELGIVEPPARTLGRTNVLDDLGRQLADRPEFAARISRDLLARIRELTSAINDLEQEIRRRTAAIAPTLLALPECGHLTAAKLVGETSGIGRFRSRAAFANHNGTAPIPVWSGNLVRHRLNPGGNRQLNAALHRIAVTQLRGPGGGREYVARRMAAGDTKLEAIRALRRRISDEVFRRLQRDEALRASLPAGLRAAA